MKHAVRAALSADIRDKLACFACFVSSPLLRHKHKSQSTHFLRKPRIVWLSFGLVIR